MVWDKTKENRSYDTVHAQILRDRVRDYIGQGEREQLSVCVRPIADHLIQFDDGDAQVLADEKPFLFGAFETSPGSIQAWAAMLPGTPKEVRDRVRRRWLVHLKGRANGGAYGAIRWPGSLNVKEERRQPDGTFPRVTTIYSNPGRYVTEEELEAAGHLAPEPPPPPPLKTEARKVSANLNPPVQWPDWNVELSRSNLKKNGERQHSEADLKWCKRAFEWRWSRSEIKSMLLDVSPRAKEKTEHYIERTLDRAEQWADVGGRAC
jgi:hypothetical protein